MRLVFFSNVFPNPYQPLKGVFNLDLVKALAQEHEVRVVSPIPWPDEWRARQAGQGPIGHSRRSAVGGLDCDFPVFYYPPKVLRSQYGRFLWLSARRRLRRLLGPEPPDAVLSYWAHPDGEVAVRAAHEAGVPAIVMVGGSDVLVLSASRARRAAIGRVLRSADAVITVSQDLRAKILEYGVSAGSVHVVRRGVDAGKFFPGDRAGARGRLGIPSGVSVLVWVGRMVEVKGLDVLIDACARLRSDGTAFRLYLVGDGPLRTALEERTSQRGLSDAVTFVAALPHDELADWYRSADLVVLPSRSEGIPNVLLEALACGTPFVASRVGGVPEIADDPERQLVPPGDPGALAAAIAGALGSGLQAKGGQPSGLSSAVDAITSIVHSLRRQLTEASAPLRRQA